VGVTIRQAAANEGTAADAALIDFVTEHYDRLLRLARLICRDTADAADAVQLGLEQAWRKRSALRDETRLSLGLTARGVAGRRSPALLADEPAPSS
jgi:hypothetical protein